MSMLNPPEYLPMTVRVRNELIVNCVIVSITILVVTLRVIGRIHGPGLGWDDYAVMVAMPMGVAMLICQGMFSTSGSGYNLAEQPQLVANIPWILQLTFGMQPVYITLLALCKASMLFFYLRIFPTSFIKMASRILLGGVTAWTIAFVFASIFLCTPVSGSWTGVGRCGAYIPFIQSIIATNAVGDVIIMAIPMKSLWRLQKRTQEKLAIISCFSLASACVVCAIFRIIYISTVDLNSNITGTMPTTVLLFVLEPNLAILCVSIPMLRPFFVRFKQRLGFSVGSSGAAYASGGQSKPSRLNSQTGDATWEMSNYGPKKGNHDIEVGATTLADDSSEKNLTAPEMNRDIRVQTTWAVTQERV
ncbi:hypothetical protein B0I35DRAFT_509912 [Stachybotrys elegans]|uniref:Rhodopsin domain-containing protein n=1 Tax=Stachybotrys elegans TaxID=80388 RepID=A0A8K0T0Q6_9HYPO|nr:hypothetical protein B0I35DRAFT_509912 [Stachybotrys elegans]